MQFATTCVSLIAAASAIMVNSPAQNAVWTQGQPQTISWTSVNTDPSYVSVYLVNFSRYPTSSVLLAENVTTSSDSLSIDGSQLTTGSAYQINLIVPTNNEQILAQSNQFSIVAGAVSSASSTASSSSTTKATTLNSAPATTATTAASAATTAAAIAGSNSTVSLPRSNSTISSTTSKASVNYISGSFLVLALGSAALFL